MLPPDRLEVSMTLLKILSIICTLVLFGVLARNRHTWSEWNSQTFEAKSWFVTVAFSFAVIVLATMVLLVWG